MRRPLSTSSTAITWGAGKLRGASGGDLGRRPAPSHNPYQDSRISGRAGSVVRTPTSCRLTSGPASWAGEAGHRLAPPALQRHLTCRCGVFPLTRHLLRLPARRPVRPPVERGWPRGRTRDRSRASAARTRALVRPTPRRRPTAPAPVGRTCLEMSAAVLRPRASGGESRRRPTAGSVPPGPRAASGASGEALRQQRGCFFLRYVSRMAAVSYRTTWLAAPGVSARGPRGAARGCPGPTSDASMDLRG